MYVCMYVFTQAESLFMFECMYACTLCILCVCILSKVIMYHMLCLSGVDALFRAVSLLVGADAA